jgi:hypothetical protein
VSPFLSNCNAELLSQSSPDHLAMNGTGIAVWFMATRFPTDLTTQPGQHRTAPAAAGLTVLALRVAGSTLTTGPQPARWGIPPAIFEEYVQ